MSNREEMLREFVLEAVANDYESFSCVLEQVTKWAGDKELIVARDEIAIMLERLIHEGYAKAYILSPHPPHSQSAEFSQDHLDDLWYYLTHKGREFVAQL